MGFPCISVTVIGALVVVVGIPVVVVVGNLVVVVVGAILVVSAFGEQHHRQTQHRVLFAYDEH